MNKLEDGVKLATSGRFLEAKNVFESILLEDPKNPDALYNLGICFTELNQPVKVKRLSHTMPMHGSHNSIYDNIGEIHAKGLA